MSMHSSDSQPRDTGPLTPDELARIAAEERADDRFANSGGHYPTDRLPTSRVSSIEVATVTDALDTEEEVHIPTDEEREFVRGLIADLKSRRASRQNGTSDVIQPDKDESTVDDTNGEVQESPKPDRRALKETARRLTLETGVSHGIKTDIHGKPTVVRYDKK